MTTSRITAIYRDTGVEAYKANPLIEALPPLLDAYDATLDLKSTLKFEASDLAQSRVIRAHNICRIQDDFFQPLSSHMALNERVSIMIRGGYVGRNPQNGMLQRHLQNGYERVQRGELSAFRYDDVGSTAQSMLLIGCSGSGKTTSLKRVLSAYPQVIYHPEMNLEQVVYLKIDCSHNGSLKEICLNFFRALDHALGENYEKRYGLKKHGIETMLALMAQIANAHALGLLVIDEIQHLSRSKSGGSQETLNFFVTMVNTIGVPVMLIGTPKARDIFEADLRSARRGAGFGAIYWEPMPQYFKGAPNNEWIGFTNNLWKLQLLQKRDLLLSDDIRALWFDLSQGVMDIVVKLFILAQLRALALGKERITTGLLQQVYDDDLIPVHPMLEALRSGIPERIARYSDLMVPEMDKRLIQLQQKIASISQETPATLAMKELPTEDEQRIYMMLQEDYDSTLLVKTIRNVFSQNPQLTRQQLLPIILKWLMTPVADVDTPPEIAKPKKQTSIIKSKDWDRLKPDSLRYMYSQNSDPTEIYNEMVKAGYILKLSDILQQAG